MGDILDKGLDEDMRRAMDAAIDAPLSSEAEALMERSMALLRGIAERKRAEPAEPCAICGEEGHAALDVPMPACAMETSFRPEWYEWHARDVLETITALRAEVLRNREVRAEHNARIDKLEGKLARVAPGEKALVQELERIKAEHGRELEQTQAKHNELRRALTLVRDNLLAAKKEYAEEDARVFEREINLVRRIDTEVAGRARWKRTTWIMFGCAVGQCVTSIVIWAVH